MKLKLLHRWIAQGLPLFSLLAIGSTNYDLQTYGFGPGGGVGVGANADAQATVGGPGQDLVGGNYDTRAGYQATQQADVPPAPAVTNPATYYDRLHVVVSPGPNPSDATFALQISTAADFSAASYVKADHGLGSALAPSDYQTYAAWGGLGGFDVLGLESDTTYYLRVKAAQGSFTETGWGPAGSAATDDFTLTFDLDVSNIDEETAAPYVTVWPVLNAGTVTNAQDLVWVDLSTNALAGAWVWVRSANAGLSSTQASSLISSQTADLTNATTGYGAQVASVNQTSGATLTSQSPYNGGGEQVGIVDGSWRSIVAADGPLQDGRASVALKAKAGALTPAGADYNDVLTFSAAAAF